MHRYHEPISALDALVAVAIGVAIAVAITGACYLIAARQARKERATWVKPGQVK